MGSLELIEKGDLLIFRNQPMLFWMFGGMVAAVMLIAGFVIPSANLILYAGAVAVALWAATRTAITAKFNFGAHIVSVRHRNLFRYKFEVYQFDELEGALYVRETEIQSTRDGQPTKVFTLLLPMKSGDDVELASETNFGTQVEDAARRINLLMDESRRKLAATGETRQLDSSQKLRA